jgi:hypothetical protein
MFDLEQEHIDHIFGSQDELNLSFAHSQSTRNDFDFSEVNAIVADGRFALLVKYPQYCRFTDGYLGIGTRLIASYATREQANAAARSLTDDFDGSEETWYEIEPKAATPPAPVSESGLPFNDDDFPF